MHHHSIKILYWALIAVIAQGCVSASEEEGMTIPEPEVSYPIVLATEAQSRAYNYLQDLGVTMFEVFGWKETASADTEAVFASDGSNSEPYIVEYRDSKWIYEVADRGQYLKYWDLSARKYTFLAYALQSSLEVPDVTVSLKNRELSVTGLKGNTTSPTSIVYEAHYCRDNQGSFPVDFDLIKSETEPFYHPVGTNTCPAMVDIVPLRFHNIMAKVVFKIYATGNNLAGKDLTVTEFKAVASGNSHSFILQADYTFPNNFTAGAYNNPTSVTLAQGDPGVTAGTSADTATTLSESFQIPQNITDSTADITVVIGGQTYTTQIKLYQNSLNNRWDKETVYTYILVLSLDNDIILVDVLLSPWTVGGKTQTTEDNW